MKTALLFLLLMLCPLQAGKPWPGVEFTEVRAFVWDPQETMAEELIADDMTFHKGVINKEGTPLNAAQVKRVLAAQARRWKKRPVAACYSPHNAFVFYDAQKKPVAFLEICFDCLGARMKPADKDCDPDFMALAQLCSELKLSFGGAKTMEEFREMRSWALGNGEPEKPPRRKKK